MPKKWVLHPDRPDEARRLATALRVAEVTARLLVNRGLTEPAEAQSFLQPSLHELKDPCNHPPAVEAARFLLDAVRAGRRIAIFGDYDADGICAAALLIRCFRYLDTEVELYIPHRVEEGYGLSCEALAELADHGTEVVITVDCGVSAAAEVAYARERGIEMVITDHHEPGERLPEARHLLDPKLPSCSGLGYEGLAGVGVAFKLVWAIGQELSDTHRVSDEFRDFLMEALSLVAVGTVADVVPLVDENRILTHYGLKTLPAVSRPGLRALMAVSRVGAGGVSAEDVAFRLAPRLNAAGRMGDARSAVELLTTTDERHAVDLAEHLEQQNRLRKSVQQAVLQEAEERLAQQAELRERSCIVLADPGWHQGVVGLVASRLAEKYWRPAFVFTANGHVACGSARSVPGFPLFAIVKECAGLLERFGGHQGAAGMTLRMENLPAFTEKVCGLAARFFGAERPSPALELDGEVRLTDLNRGLLSEISRLEPFGNGNPEPCFAACGLQLVGHPRLVGSAANHLTFMVRQDRCVLRAIAMRRTDWLEEFRARRGEPFALAFQPYVSTYGGKVSVELRAEDLRWESDGAFAADSGQAS